MTLPAPTYDLVLLLDLKAEDAARAKIVADARSAIESQGDLLRHDEWGERPLTYPIDRKASAEYHLLQFHAGAPDLLSGLDRALRITDGVMRFRIIKLRPGVPDAPEMPAASAPAAGQAPQAEPVVQEQSAETTAVEDAPAAAEPAAAEPEAAEPQTAGEQATDAAVAEPA